MKDPFKFKKSVYRDRRNKGYHGQVHPKGSPEQRYDDRLMMRKIRIDHMKKLRKGIKNEPIEE
jgi:hypothetical protein